MGQLPGLEPMEICGAVERVVFHNAENGFSILRLMPDGAKDAVTIVGRIPSPGAGSRLKVRGEWVENPRFGRQFKVESHEEIMPSGVDSIRLYLSSGLIKGVGPSMAAKIVKKFGEDTIRVLDEEPDLLLSIPGIGVKNFTRIKETWGEHRGIRELMLFLQPHGVSPAYAVRVYRHYGRDALGLVRENPYRMAMDVHGIGFASADAVATQLGFAADSPLRAEAALLYSLLRLCDEGHVYVPKDKLFSSAASLVGLDDELCEEGLAGLLRDERVVLEEQDGEEAVYPRRLYFYETKTSFYLKRILNSPRSVSFNNADAIIAEVLAGLTMTLAPEQEEAVRATTRSKVQVITGGPGTGKTTIIKAIISVFSRARAKILLAAPTGRAAKRMAETCGQESKTIHRLLEYSPQEDEFARNESNPLACGLLIVDEASMMDAMLFFHLLKAVPLGATVVLVGDVHQLPSVGPGNVLSDIIESGATPVARLYEIFRQSAESRIICHAHMINNGEVPPLESSRDVLSDFYFIYKSNPEEAAAMIVDLVRNHIPRRFHLDPLNDVQVLTPMHKGSVGAMNLNNLLQEALNPQKSGPCLQRGDRRYLVGDKVMQVRNNYDKDVFNGDIGRITFIDPEDKSATVRYDDRTALYEGSELDEIIPAYAISVHKSQGSEYPAVVIPLMMQHYMLLQRNLIYTAVTRGKKLVILVGEKKALSMAVKNNRMLKRHTRLACRLRESCE